MMMMIIMMMIMKVMMIIIIILISVKGWVDPRTIVRPEGYVNENLQKTFTSIDQFAQRSPVTYARAVFHTFGKTDGFIWTARTYRLWKDPCRCVSHPHALLSPHQRMTSRSHGFAFVWDTIQCNSWAVSQPPQYVPRGTQFGKMSAVKFHSSSVHKNPQGE
jgi:hypothetical protein